MSDQVRENTVSAYRQTGLCDDTFCLGEGEQNKILILGNSITFHAEKPEIGWCGRHGMAASSAEKDYVHILFRLLSDKRPCRMMIRQAACWETDWEKFDLNLFLSLREFAADAILFRLGENIVNTERSGLTDAIEKLINFVNPKKSPVFYTTCFWRRALADEAIRAAAERSESTLIELNDLGDCAENKAVGLFRHEGVAAHPGDLGMERIAARIYESCRTTFEK